MSPERIEELRQENEKTEKDRPPKSSDPLTERKNQRTEPQKKRLSIKQTSEKSPNRSNSKPEFPLFSNIFVILRARIIDVFLKIPTILLRVENSKRKIWRVFEAQGREGFLLSEMGKAFVPDRCIDARAMLRKIYDKANLRVSE